MWRQLQSPSFLFQSLIRFLGEAHRGVRGFVVDESGNLVEGATMKIKDKEVGFRSTRYGEFWRIVLPGRHFLEVKDPNLFSRFLPTNPLYQITEKS